MLVKLFKKNRKKEGNKRKDAKPYKLTRVKVKPGQWDDDPVMVRKKEEGLKLLQRANLPEEIRKRIQK